MKGNIIPCCKNCNSSKHNKVFEEWYKEQPFFSEERKNKIIKFVKSNRQLALF